VEIAITKMSSKGQVVIPAEMRGNIHEGEKLVIIDKEMDDKNFLKALEKW
jgi:AbrB family looped-hinge helix DNA binding protein